MAESSAKVSLGCGWKMERSKNHPDRIYYFNVFSGSSTWEYPELDPPKAVNPSLESDDCSPKSRDMPTAVVSPLIQEQVKFNVSVEPKLLLSKEVRQDSSQKLKRKVDDLEDRDTTVKKKKIYGRRKKDSCLNMSDDQKETFKDSQVEKSNEPSDALQGISIEEGMLTGLPVSSPSENKDAYYIVIDTTVLISDLNLVNELKETPLNGCGPPYIFIPWDIIEELDKLKTNRNNRKAACKAVSYLNSVLRSHPRFLGQTPMEAQKLAQIYSQCNGDKILECCMALGDKMPKEKVILLSNNKKFIKKALLLDITAHNWASMLESVKPDTKFNFSKNGNDSKEKRKKSRSSENESRNKVAAAAQIEQKMLQERNVYKQKIHTIMSSARKVLKNSLSRFLYIEMNEVYGSTWLSFPIQRNLLDGILEAILKYWTYVFCVFMSEDEKRIFEFLHEKVSRPEGFLAGGKEECLVILSSVEIIFRSVKRRRIMIRAPVKQIQDFHIAIVNAFDAYDRIDSTIKQEEQKSVLALFDRNWNTINQLGGLVLDTCGVQHNFQYDKPSEMLSDVQVRQLIVNLYPGVQQLKEKMFVIHTAIQECKPATNAIKKLSQSLLNFIPSMNLPSYEPFTCHHFSAKALEMFFTNSQNRKMIEIGCKQIERYYTKLDEALVTLCRKSVQRNV